MYVASLPKQRVDIIYYNITIEHDIDQFFSWASHLLYKKRHQIKMWVPLALGRKIGP